MSDTFSETDILEGVISIVSLALRIKSQEIRPSSRLFKDLNAESLDIVDIRFQVEHKFGFRIDQGEIYRNLGRELTVDEVHEKLTVTAIADFIRFRLAQENPVP